MKSKIVLSLLLFTPSFVMAESIELSTGEVVDGKLLEFPKTVTIELQDGTKKTVPYEGITSIYKNKPPQSFSPFLSKEKTATKTPLEKSKPEKDEFAELDPTKGPYGSPTQTFLTWKNAALADDIDGMSNCYVSYRKKDVKKELKKISPKTRGDMKMAMIETIFTPSEPYYQGEYAILEISWAKGLASQTQTLKFALENNKDWKIVE